jgi:hypothetical protein
MARRALIPLAFVAFLTVVSPAAARPFETGFFDGVYLEDQSWLQRSADVGAGIIRLDPGWAVIAPAEPPAAFDARNPADPAYNWSRADAAIRAAAASGLEVLFTFSRAPSWAEGDGRPRNAVAGSWKPRVRAVADFSRAAATRYSGAFPDPLHPGQMLPRVRLWQVWNEPNLSQYLSPQWTRRRGRHKPASPGHYRRMLNAAYGEIKAVHSGNVVGTAGTAPYGDPRPGGPRIMPVRFLRSLLAKRTRLDALAHHPYGVRGPTSHSLNRDDAAVPDVNKLARVLHRAQRKGKVSRSHKRLWVTEISWDSRPPDPNGVSAARHARWLEQSFYVLWRQKVDLVTWFQVRDQARGRGYQYGNQSGVYLRDGTPKPALQAFRFPFVLDRGRRKTVAWGRAPGGGRVTVQRRTRAGWKAVKTAETGESHVFHTAIRRAPGGRYRAAQGSTVSLVWRLR